MLSQQIRNGLGRSGSLLDSLDAVRNWRAVVVLLATLVIAAGVAAFGGALAVQVDTFGLAFVLLALAVMLYGMNAAGMMMMDEANGHPSRPIGAAVMSSLVTSHRLVLVLLIIAATYLLGILAFAAVLFVCKVPGIGPFLYTIVFPVGAVVSGMAILALPTVVFPLSAPAIWNGASTIGAVSQVMALARKRLLLVLLLMFGVGLIAGVVGALVGAVLFNGAMVTTLLSAAVLGSETGGLQGIMPGLAGGLPVGAGLGEYATAAVLGGGIVYAVGLTLPVLVYLRGSSTVYLRAVEGLDLVAEQQALAGKVAAAQARAKKYQADAQATAQQYAQRAHAPAPTVSAVAFSGAGPISAATPSPVPGCSACGTPIVSGDVFCANCGNRVA